MSLFGGSEKKILGAMGYDVDKGLKSLKDFQFPAVVIKRTQDLLGCSAEEMKVVEIALLDYFLTVKSHGSIDMIDKKADELWHIFLLDTVSYMKFCSNYIGFYIHHKPYINDKSISVSEQIILANKYETASKTDYEYHSYRNNIVRNSDRSLLEVYLPLYIVLSDHNVRVEEKAQQLIDESSTSDTTPVYADSYPSATKSSCGSSCSSSSSCSSCGS